MAGIENGTKMGMFSTSENAELVRDVVVNQLGINPQEQPYEVIVIPTAGNADGNANNRFLQPVEDVLTKIGFLDIIRVAPHAANPESRKKARRKIGQPNPDSKKKLVVITDGASHYLRKHLKQSRIDAILGKKALDGDLEIITFGAGTINMGETLAFDGSRHDSRLSHISGVKIVQGGIICHYHHSHRQELADRMAETTVTVPRIITLTNEQALRGSPQDLHAAGQGAVLVFDRNNKTGMYKPRMVPQGGAITPAGPGL